MTPHVIVCPHGMRVETEIHTDLSDGYLHKIRLQIRERLLACPACRFEAEKFTDEPGP